MGENFQQEAQECSFLKFRYSEKATIYVVPFSKYLNFNITENLSVAVLRAGVDFCLKLIPGEIFVLLSLLIFRRMSDFPGLVFLNEKKIKSLRFRYFFLQN